MPTSKNYTHFMTKPLINNLMGFCLVISEPGVITELKQLQRVCKSITNQGPKGCFQLLNSFPLIQHWGTNSVT